MFVRIFGRVLSKEDVKGHWGRSRVNFRYVSISRKWYEIRPKLLLTTNRKLHVRFRLAPRLMTLDDLELLLVRIFSEFRVISQI